MRKEASAAGAKSEIPIIEGGAPKVIEIDRRDGHVGDPPEHYGNRGHLLTGKVQKPKKIKVPKAGRAATTDTDIAKKLQASGFKMSKSLRKQFEKLYKK